MQSALAAGLDQDVDDKQRQEIRDQNAHASVEDIGRDVQRRVVRGRCGVATTDEYGGGGRAIRRLRGRWRDSARWEMRPGARVSQRGQARDVDGGGRRAKKGAGERPTAECEEEEEDEAEEKEEDEEEESEER